MTHDYKAALDELEEREELYPESDAVFISSPLDSETYKTIRKALELAIALQPKPISEAAIGVWALIYDPMSELIRADKYELRKLTEYDLRYAHPRTMFYDISALPKPEVTE